MRPWLAALLLHAPAALGEPGLRGDGAVPRPPLPTGYAAEYLLGVLLVMAALAGFVLLLKRMQGRVAGARGPMRVCASLPLGGKERLLIVEVEGERLLLGAGPGSVRLVRRLRPPTAAPAPAPGAVDGWLARTLNGAPGR